MLILMTLRGFFNKKAPQCAVLFGQKINPLQMRDLINRMLVIQHQGSCAT